MNDESIAEMLESSFDYSSDDGDIDPDWDQNVENISTKIELSGVDEIAKSDENDDPNFDLVSHISTLSDNGSTTNYSGPGRPRIHPTVNVNRKWRKDDNVIDYFIFNTDTTNSGINPDLFETLVHGSPLDFYMLIVNDEIINKIVIETNRFAAQLKASRLVSPFSRINKWFDTDVAEMKQLFGLLIWTGLVGLPSYELYWSSSKVFATNVGLVMIIRRKYRDDFRYGNVYSRSGNSKSNLGRNF
ncbi:hypothetical protein QTP88_000774 [Uroleucon formosanum]